MATTYLSGTGQDLTGYTIMGQGNLDLGRIDTGTTQDADGQVLGVDVALGRIDPSPAVGFYSDRAPNVPSGTTVNGVPTYGDGKLNRNTTFSADYSSSRANSKFTYMLPAGPVDKKFSELT